MRLIQTEQSGWIGEIKKMQPGSQKESGTSLAHTVKSSEVAETDCLRIREILDELVYGRMQLEETDPVVKRIFLRHLETCSACCRSFDVRVGPFSAARRRGIF